MKNLMIKLFLRQTDSLFIQFFRYFFVGGLAFVVDFGLLYFLTEFAGFYYLFSATISFTAGLCVNYIVSIKWVFSQNKGLKNKKIEFLIFSFIGIVGLLLNAIFIWFFTEKLLFYYMISKVLSTVIVYFWNFFARKYILYKR
jgi:putative flippase GtrA